MSQACGPEQEGASLLSNGIDCTDLVGRCLPAPQRSLLVDLARREGLQLAIVGGAVRDALLHRLHCDPWRGLPDLDLVVESVGCGDAAGTPAAHRLARALQAVVPDMIGFCRFHGDYGTVELELAGLLLDLASARRERYPVAARNPVVRSGRLVDDLARRDFSINAMAVVVDPRLTQPQLLDPHHGLADLQARTLRFLHADSLRDDPSRLLRAARYGARLGLALEPGSLDQAQRVMALWPWPWRPGDPPGQAPAALGTRLRMELDLLLEHEPWPQALTLLQRWGGLALLDAQLQRDPHWRLRICWARRFGLPALVALVAGAAEPLPLAERLQLPHRQQRLLQQCLLLQRWLSTGEAEDPPRSPAAWCALLERPGLSPEAVALALACGARPRRPLLRWWLRWRHIRAPLSATALMRSEGLSPGPQLGERLAQLRAACLDQLA